MAPSNKNNISVTFAIPGDNRSGGVRVTVLMANLLLKNGYDVRIVYPIKNISVNSIFNFFERKFSAAKQNNNSWINEFKGSIQSYKILDNLRYKKNEVVFAVGTYMVEDVRRMRSKVIKVRYNHGFPAMPTRAQIEAWKVPMITITVSSTLIPRLKELSGGDVWAIIPNGIDTHEYFVEPHVDRNGVGAIFSSHPNKGPRDLTDLLILTKKKFPKIPQYVFSTESVPKRLKHAHFLRYPSVAEARRLYNQSKVWLLTSYTEGLPGSVLEAMACGCVVISTDNDGSLEIIKHEQNGIIVPKGDLDCFIRQIDRVVTDSKLYSRLSTMAQETAKKYTWENAFNKMDKFLKEVSTTDNNRTDMI